MNVSDEIAQMFSVDVKKIFKWELEFELFLLCNMLQRVSHCSVSTIRVHTKLTQPECAWRLSLSFSNL